MRVSLMLIMVAFCHCYSMAQTPDYADTTKFFPSNLLAHLKARTSDDDRELTRQTASCLKRMSRKEERLRRQLYKIDSNSAKQLFAESAAQYTSFLNRMKSDTGARGQSVAGSYLPYVDSLKGSLNFLKQNPQLLESGQLAQLEGASSQFQVLEAKMADADAVKAYIQQRKQIIGQYISQHAGAQQALGASYASFNQKVYYYSQQVRQFKEMWNNPDQLEQRALSFLNRLPAFQSFMKNNSQLGGLFNLPGNYSSSASLAGLQTRDQVAQLIQAQIGAGGPSAASTVQSNMQAAQSQLDGYKDKLSQLGAGNGDMDMPDFKPNDQKTKTFLGRLEYGANFQTSRNSYYFPTVTDLGVSFGYRLNHINSIGIGASYKVGWGNGFQHIALSSQGVGLRSFFEIKIKGTFSATGGFEMNYTQPFKAYRELQQLQDWTRSGLIGVEKTISANNRVFKKTKLQLLWDFLSYQQIPKTQPLLFRVAYNF